MVNRVSSACDSTVNATKIIKNSPLLDIFIIYKDIIQFIYSKSKNKQNHVYRFIPFYLNKLTFSRLRPLNKFMLFFEIYTFWRYLFIFTKLSRASKATSLRVFPHSTKVSTLLRTMKFRSSLSWLSVNPVLTNFIV